MVTRRTHTNANIARSIWRLREQVNAAYPNRSKASDGIWPSAAHTRANPTSDHELGNAFDITADLGNGRRVQELFDALKANNDPRLKYIIHNGRIYSHSRGDRIYTGANPHTSHMHVSVYETDRDDGSDWQLSKEDTVTTPYRIVTAECATLVVRNAVAKMCADRNMAHAVLGRAVVFHGHLERVREVEAYIEARPDSVKRTHGVMVEAGTHNPLNQHPPHGRFTDDEAFAVDTGWRQKYDALRAAISEVIARN